jgi:hypothetical protein
MNDHARPRRLLIAAMLVDTLGGGLLSPFELDLRSQIAGLSLTSSSLSRPQPASLSARSPASPSTASDRPALLPSPTASASPATYHCSSGRTAVGRLPDDLNIGADASTVEPG